MTTHNARARENVQETEKEGPISSPVDWLECDSSSSRTSKGERTPVYASRSKVSDVRNLLFLAVHLGTRARRFAITSVYTAAALCGRPSAASVAKKSRFPLGHLAICREFIERDKLQSRSFRRLCFALKYGLGRQPNIIGVGEILGSNVPSYRLLIELSALANYVPPAR